ncbi:TPA: hypothetical protein RG418_001202 [Aeromonas hydrophila]|nr:hypothetical protein [Aeromonas hydrophila]
MKRFELPREPCWLPADLWTVAADACEWRSALRRRQAQNNWGNDPAGGTILSLQYNLSQQMMQEECFCAQLTVVLACCLVADKPDISDKNHIKH